MRIIIAAKLGQDGVSGHGEWAKKLPSWGLSWGFFSPHWLNCECIIHEPTAKDKDGGGPPEPSAF